MLSNARVFVAACGLVLLVGSLEGQGQADGAIFTPLVAPGTQNSLRVNGISADGSVLVGTYEGEVIRWTDDGSYSVVPSVGDGSGGDEGQAVSGDGSVITGWVSTSSGHRRAFRWTQSDGMSLLPVVIGEEDTGSQGYAINYNGSVVVGTNRTGIVWPSSGDPFAVGGSEVLTGVDGSGSIFTGYYYNREVPNAFIWTIDEGMTRFPKPQEGYYSSPTGISENGEYAYGQLAGGKAFTWSLTEGVRELPSLSGFSGWSTSAMASNGDGSVVAGSARDTDHQGPPSEDPEIAFLWDEDNGTRSLKQVLVDDYGLELDGWELARATSMSADGLSIAGYGFDPEGERRGWVVRLAEPGDFNRDGSIDTHDLIMLEDAIAGFEYDINFDVQRDYVLDEADFDVFLEEIVGTGPGDANLDGLVDLIDLSMLAANFGQFPRGWTEGDFDGSGEVTLSDLSILATNFGKTAGVTVPEPSLGLVGLALLLRLRSMCQ